MLRFLCIIAGVVTCDQLSKLWILKHLALYESVPVLPGLFNLTSLHNTGAAFGMLRTLPEAWRQIFFISVGLIALLFLGIMQYKMGRKHLWYTLSFALIGGGALGNLVDRLLYGSVVDFLDVHIGPYHWPAFNIADSGITTGVGIFLLVQFLEKEEGGET